MPYPILFVPFMKPDGMALFPFILIRNKRSTEMPTLLRHETIHLKQQLELLVIPFYFLYVANYLFNLIRYANHREAYLNILFEREAYLNETDADYLKKRKFWAWVKS